MDEPRADREAGRTKPQAASPFLSVLKIFGVLAFLYLFMLSIKLMGSSFKGFGQDFAEGLVAGTSSPIVGLFVGILTTSIIQSSSTVTSMLVALVATGSMGIGVAVPIVLGANIGTTITNTIVSLTHITRRDEFHRAMAGATVHDMFNICAVAVLMPVEYLFHPLEKLGCWLAGVSATGGGGGFAFMSPLNAVTDPIVDHIIGLTGGTYWLALAIALALLFVSLRYLVKLIRSLLIERFERVLHGYLFKTPIRAFVLGLLFTAIVQSSSVTTSLVVPLVGAALLTVEQVFPYTLGANVGTTVTALLAALAAGEPAGLAVAFVHMFFNVFGIAIFYPLRVVPLTLAKTLSNLVKKNRAVAIVFIGVIFFLIPVLVIFVFN
ncbi:MAG TPA: Na/Pi symporter [bacterium]|nr:Na/Pi symporter [bacterium]